MISKYKYVLFDWDGCLAKTLEVWLDAYKTVFARFDKFPSDSTIATEVFGNWQGAATQGVEDVEGFVEQLMAEVNENIKAVDLYEDVPELLNKLTSSGASIALLSSSLRDLIEPALDRHKVSQYFAFILDGKDVEHHKPDPEVINKAIEKFGAEKSEVVMIGDSKSDLGAANNARVDSMLFYPESHKLFYDEETLLAFKPSKVFSDFSELEKNLFD